MLKLRFLRLAAAAVCLGLLASRPTLAAENHFKTPEDAITAYISAVAQQDFEAVVATTAVEAKSKRYDWAAQVGSAGGLMPNSPLPSSDPFFMAINKANFIALVGRQVQVLVYGLMSSSEIAAGRLVRMKKGDLEAFLASVQAKRLAGLSLVKTGVPNPTLLNGKINQSNWAIMAKTIGADVLTERVALLSFEGADYALGFGLARYGEDWFVVYQASNIADKDPFMFPTRITPEAFEDVLK